MSIRHSGDSQWVGPAVAGTAALRSAAVSAASSSTVPVHEPKTSGGTPRLPAGEDAGTTVPPPAIEYLVRVSKHARQHQDEKILLDNKLSHAYNHFHADGQASKPAAHCLIGHLSMKARMVLVALLTLIPLMVFGRLFQIIDPKKLVADSKLVFVGKVESVKTSGIATTLSYPTWEGVSFPWLRVKMQVLVPFKGVQQDDIVQVMMLSIDKSKARGIMYSLPEVIEPDKGDIFFLCLGPTPIINAFAAVTGPYDENLSVFPLYRSDGSGIDSMTNDWRRLFLDDKRFAPIWQLVNPSGDILPDGVAKLRETYAAEIGKAPTNDMVYLEWQAYTNAHGWVSDVPKGFSPTNSDFKK